MSSQSLLLMKALADETRLDALEYLYHNGETSCQELMKRFSLSQPTLSHHFNKLVDAHILKQRKDGVLWFYWIDTEFLLSQGISLAKFFRKSEGGE